MLSIPIVPLQLARGSGSGIIPDMKTIWAKTNEGEWSREDYDDLGLHDLVRVKLRFYVGSGPGKPDMKVAITTESRLDLSHSGRMVDTTRHAGNDDSAQSESDQDPVFLGEQLSAIAQERGILFLDLPA